MAAFALTPWSGTSLGDVLNFWLSSRSTSRQWGSKSVGSSLDESRQQVLATFGAHWTGGYRQINWARLRVLQPTTGSWDQILSRCPIAHSTTDEQYFIFFAASLFPTWHDGCTWNLRCCAARFGHTQIRCGLYWIKFVGQIWPWCHIRQRLLMSGSSNWAFNPHALPEGEGWDPCGVGWCPCIFPSFDLNATESLYVETLVSSIHSLVEEICCVLAVCLLVSYARLTTDLHTVNSMSLTKSLQQVLHARQFKMRVEARPRIMLVDRSIGAHPSDQDIPSRVATGYGVDSALLDLLWAPIGVCNFWSRENGFCCSLFSKHGQQRISTWSEWHCPIHALWQNMFFDQNPRCCKSISGLYIEAPKNLQWMTVITESQGSWYCCQNLSMYTSNCHWVCKRSCTILHHDFENALVLHALCFVPDRLLAAKPRMFAAHWFCRKIDGQTNYIIFKIADEWMCGVHPRLS